jgi:hypothetical protein
MLIQMSQHAEPNYKARRPTIPMAPAMPAPTMAVGMEAPACEEEEEPAEPLLPEPDEPEEPEMPDEELLDAVREALETDVIDVLLLPMIEVEPALAAVPTAEVMAVPLAAAVTLLEAPVATGTR